MSFDKILRNGPPVVQSRAVASFLGGSLAVQAASGRKSLMCALQCNHACETGQPSRLRIGSRRGAWRSKTRYCSQPFTNRLAFPSLPQSTISLASIVGWKLGGKTEARPTSKTLGRAFQAPVRTILTNKTAHPLKGWFCEA